MASCGEDSPVMMAVVPSTMAMSAGMEMGKSNSGSMTSRLRVRSEMAAKNVPFTTSAQVPSTKMMGSLAASPTMRRSEKMMKSGASRASTRMTNRKFPTALPKKRELGGAGETR